MLCALVIDRMIGYCSMRATQGGLKKREQPCCFDLERENSGKLMDGGTAEAHTVERIRDARHNH